MVALPGLLGQTRLSTAWILSSGLRPAGESWVEFHHSTQLFCQQVEGVTTTPTPC